MSSFLSPDSCVDKDLLIISQSGENVPFKMLTFQLEIAFNDGLLKPGLNVVVPREKTYVNNIVSTASKI